MLPPIVFIAERYKQFNSLSHITLGQHIQQKRRELQLFQTDLQKLFNVSEATIVHWERESTVNIPVSMYPKIITFLNYCPIEPCTHQGQKLSLFRKYSGMTQKQLAKELGSDERYVQSWESGDYKIPYEKKAQLKQIFNYEFHTAQPSYTYKLPKELKTIGDHLKAKRLKQRMSVKNALKHFSINASSTYRNWEDQNGIGISAIYYPEIIQFLNYCPIETFTTAGEKLALYRKHAGMTQRDLAKKLGCRDTTIIKWEKGQIRIPKRQVTKLQKQLMKNIYVNLKSTTSFSQ